MPYTPARPCNYPGCSALVERGRFCTRHRAPMRPLETRPTNPVYSTTKHRLWRKMVLHRDPVCRTCKEQPATHADHVIPLARGGGWSLDNGQGLCQECHNRKTARERVEGARSQRGALDSVDLSKSVRAEALEGSAGSAGDTPATHPPTPPSGGHTPMGG